MTDNKENAPKIVKKVSPFVGDPYNHRNGGGRKGFGGAAGGKSVKPTMNNSGGARNKGGSGGDR